MYPGAGLLDPEKVLAGPREDGDIHSWFDGGDQLTGTDLYQPVRWS